MLTLRQILELHGPLLLIDAASARVQVGWLEPDRPSRWSSSDQESGVGIFQAIAELGVDPAAARAFAFCDGPGSILGVRTAAMSLRTWCVLRPRPAFAYHSLALVAGALEDAAVNVIADARRDSWHCLSGTGALRRVPTAELGGVNVTPEHFRHWSPLPDGVRTVPYALPELFGRAADLPLFREAADPDAFLHEEPSYVTWTPRVHRAP